MKQGDVAFSGAKSNPNEEIIQICGDSEENVDRRPMEKPLVSFSLQYAAERGGVRIKIKL